MTLGEKISQARKAQRLSQEALAEAAKVSSRTIQRIENNVSVPRAFTLKQIAQVLNLPDDVFNTTPPETSSVSTDAWSSVRLINASALAVILVPLSNVLIPFWLWQRNKHHPVVDSLSKQIVSFQILWTLATLLGLIGYPLLSITITGSAANGKFPWPLLIYALAVVVNITFTLNTSRHLHNQKPNIYSFIPTLL